MDRMTIVILGASGDLTKRKLMPALSGIYKQQIIKNDSVIIGTGRTEFTDREFRAIFDVPEEFKNLIFYHSGIKGLKKYIQDKCSNSRIIFFMALPPAVYIKTAEELYNEGFGENVRLIIEKPFGYDYETAIKINSNLHKFFDEKQIFRIDHYLAKEAVQNILIFRFANSLFYPVWNSRYIESIQINAFEEIGVEERGVYFDSAGIIRDMVQNHLLQLLSLLTMELPISLDASDIQTQKKNILSILRFEECYRYQYRGYLEEKGISKDSNTETYAELKLYIENFRWTSMPIYIRVGKALNRKGTEIGVKFKQLPKLLFNKEGKVPANKIIFKIQPAEGIIVDITSKTPGSDMSLSSTNMKFCYRDFFEGKIEDAYRKLLIDVLNGDKTLFVSSEEIEIAWKKIEHILDSGKLKYYEKGKVPETNFDINWIEFENYTSICD